MAQEPSVGTDKLSYEIFSILESKFLFGLDDRTLWPDLSAPPPTEGGVTAVKNQRGKICILSIDAGGMRSILPGKALAYLESAIRKKSGDQTANIADYFDIAAGTSVGGIFTAMLFGTKDHCRPISQADDTWQFLATHGKKFKRSEKKPYQFLCLGSEKSAGSVNLDKSLNELFTDEKGRCLTLKDTLKPVLIPCYDLATSAPFVFSRADALEAEGFNFRLWEVCKAASAAPAADIQPADVASVDGRTRCVAVGGGVGINNPTAVAITHVLHNKQEFPFVRGVEDILVLSLGTGQGLDGSYGYEEVKRWKAKEWTQGVGRIYGEGSADFVDHAVAMAFGQSRSSNYVRIQANGLSMGHCGPNVDFDASSSNVKKLMGIADEMLKQKNVESVLFGGKRISEESNYQKLDWFASELVLEHQRRSCRIAPTVAFKQATPKTT